MSRKAKIDQAIYQAAQKILTERGYDALNFDAISREAGVSRPTLYRRWPNKTKLLDEMSVQGRGHFPSRLESDDIKGELAKILGSVVGHYSEPWIRPAVLGLLASISASGAEYDTRSKAEKATREAFANFIAHGQDKGVVRSDINSDALFDIIVGPVLFRTLFSSGGPMPDTHLDDILALLINGIMPQRS